MKSYSSPATVQNPTTLEEFLRATWPQASGKQIKSWFKYRSISINETPMRRFDQALKAGDRVRIRSDRYVVEETKLPSGLVIRHEDAAILVIEKPSGLLTIATDKEREKTAYNKLTTWLESRNPYQPERVWIVHRLDRETSGLLVFAKTESAKRTLQKNWDSFEKRYVAIVEGTPRPPEHELQDKLDESDDFRVRIARTINAETRLAITRYKVIRESKHYSQLEIEILTGRRHQIRVQLSAHGYPVVGDERYDAKTDPIRRLALHASQLVFNHPETGKKMEFRCAIPTTFKIPFREGFDFSEVKSFKSRETTPHSSTHSTGRDASPKRPNSQARPAPRKAFGAVRRSAAPSEGAFYSRAPHSKKKNRLEK